MIEEEKENHHQIYLELLFSLVYTLIHCLIPEENRKSRSGFTKKENDKETIDRES